MKKLIIILLGYLLLISCKEKKTEFIQSNTMPHIFLIKNVPDEDFLLKNQISDFLIKKTIKNADKLPQINFYRYTYNTKYFTDHLPDPGGFSSEELSNYPEDKIAAFIISKCKNDSTKLVGELYFYGLESRVAKIDTLIYKCN